MRNVIKIISFFFITLCLLIGNNVSFALTESELDIKWLNVHYDFISNAPSENKLVVSQKQQWGVIDTNGNIILPLQSKYCLAWHEFSEELLAAQNTNNDWGFINQNGEEVIACQYEYVSNFNNGLAAVVKNGKLGYIDKTGKQVIPCQFQYQDMTRGGMITNRFDFHEGFAKTIEDGKYGFIDKTAKIAIACQYDYVMNFNQGLAAVKKDGKWGFINKKAGIIVPFIYNEVFNFNEDRAIVINNHKFGVINKKGELIIPLIYDEMDDFSEGLAAFKIGEKYGYIDKNGNTVIPAIYDDAQEFSDGLALVHGNKDNNTFNNIFNSGYMIDKTGKKIIDFPIGGSFKNGIAVIERENNIGIIKNPLRQELKANDLTIQWLDGYDADFSKYNTIYKNTFNNGLVRVQKNGKYGYIDKNGQEVIACQYDKAQNFSDGLAAVKKNNKWGYINTASDTVIAFHYEHAGEFNEGLATVVVGGKLGYIDKEAQTVIPYDYDFEEINAVNENYEIGDYHNFSDDYALVSKNGKWGVVNKSGEFKILPYEKIMPYSDGLAAVRQNQNWGLIDTSGKEIIACQYYRNVHFNDGIASVEVYDYKDNVAVGTHCEAIDKEGKKLFTPELPFTAFSEKLAAAYDNNTHQFGYIDTTGKIIIPAQYDLADDFHQGAALVYKDVDNKRRAGFINTKGDVILPLNYEINSNFNEGAVLIKKDGKLGILKQKRYTSTEQFEAVYRPLNIKIHYEPENQDSDELFENVQAYAINHDNYFKLRDIARILNNTPVQFSINWDDKQKRIALKKNEAYKAKGSELQCTDKTNKIAKKASLIITVDDELAHLDAYTIDNQTYVGLNQLSWLIGDGEIFGNCRVFWDKEKEQYRIEIEHY